MDTEKNTETVTRVPAELYDEMAAEGPDEPNEKLRDAAVRAREVIVHPESEQP